MKEIDEMGMNRTGIGTSPIDSKELERGVEESEPTSPGDEGGIAAIRALSILSASSIGTMPPPTTVRGAVHSVLEGFTKNPGVFLDKLGERLAFERTGIRLYEALITKLDARGSFDGGPSRDIFCEFHDEELRHFHVLKSALESLGADPTAVSPSADISGVLASGIIQVVADPRATLVQSLEAMLLAELADGEGWDLLVELSENLDHEAMADDFRDALRAEERHLAHVRQWVAGFTQREAEGILQKAA